MSNVKDHNEVDTEEIDDILQNMIELIQNLIAILGASENWKEATFWQSQIEKLERDVQFHSRTVMMFDCYSYLSLDLEDIERAKSEAVAFKMVAGLDSKGFEKVKGYLKDVNEYRDKTEETDYNVSLTDDESKLDVKPNVDKALARKEDYGDVEKVKPEETEDIQFKYDDKLDDPLKDGNLDRKEEYEVVEKVKDDLEKVKFSEIKMTRTLTN